MDVPSADGLAEPELPFVAFGAFGAFGAFRSLVTLGSFDGLGFLVAAA